MKFLLYFCFNFLLISHGFLSNSNHYDFINKNNYNKNYISYKLVSNKFASLSSSNFASLNNNKTNNNNNNKVKDIKPKLKDSQNYEVFEDDKENEDKYIFIYDFEDDEEDKHKYFEDLEEYFNEDNNNCLDNDENNDNNDDANLIENIIKKNIENDKNKIIKKYPKTYRNNKNINNTNNSNENLNQKDKGKIKDINSLEENPYQIGIRLIYPIGNIPEQMKKLLNENNENSKKYRESNENNENKKNKKSENFDLIYNNDFNFSNVGGYDIIKEDLLQCADMLVNYTKYSKYNVRTPKGIILEGPPGNGKTMISRAFSGEIDVGFIPVSGSQFHEKYVGVGASRIRELFKLANDNKPCIIFIDEIDALGRKRSTDNEASTSERDSTLNELLVALDGFKSSNGVFLIGATNRIDLLDEALIRPGRIDKQIYIGNPDKKTRKSIINIHLNGKPYDETVKLDHLIELTSGFSGAQIENFLNEGMLYALRKNREFMTIQDLEIIANRILVGWQSNEIKLSQEMLFQVAIHEIGHALICLFTNYSNLVKVTINLWSPKSLGFTLFEPFENDIGISTREKLINEIMVLLGGRVAEEIFFGNKISSGAVKDLEQVRNLIQKMVLQYGMGNSLMIPYNSDKYREKIDFEIEQIFNKAYQETKYLLSNSKQLIRECADLLVIEHELTKEQILNKIDFFNGKSPM